MGRPWEDWLMKNGAFQEVSWQQEEEQEQGDFVLDRKNAIFKVPQKPEKTEFRQAVNGILLLEDRLFDWTQIRSEQEPGNLFSEGLKSAPERPVSIVLSFQRRLSLGGRGGARCRRRWILEIVILN